MEMGKSQAMFFMSKVFEWRKSRPGTEHLFHFFIHGQVSFPANEMKCLPQRDKMLI